MAYGVTRRTAEIGVRMVLREGLLLAVIGMAVAVPVALWLARFASSLLFGLEAQ